MTSLALIYSTSNLPVPPPLLASVAISVITYALIFASLLSLLLECKRYQLGDGNEIVLIRWTILGKDHTLVHFWSFRCTTVTINFEISRCIEDTKNIKTIFSLRSGYGLSESTPGRRFFLSSLTSASWNNCQESVVKTWNELPDHVVRAIGDEGSQSFNHHLLASWFR